MGLRGCTGGKKAGYSFYQDGLSSLEVGAGSEKRPQQPVCYKIGNKSAGLHLEKRENENLNLAYLLIWQAQLAGSQGMPAGVGGWENRMSEERGLRRRSALSIRYGSREEVSLQQLVCYRVGGKRLGNLIRKIGER